MKKLELIYTEKTRELIKNNEKLKVIELYLLDYDLIEKHRDISKAIIKVKNEPSSKSVLEKVLEVIEELYPNQEYVVLYDKL